MKNTQPRIWRAGLASAAMAFCTATALTGAFPANASSQPTSGSTVASVTRVSSLSALPRGVRPAIALPKCIPVIDAFNRTHECWLEEITFTFFRNTTLIGANEVFFFQYITLVANSPNWSEEDEVVATVPHGRTAPIIAHLVASCGAHCTARAHLTGVLKRGLMGKVSYSTSVGKNAKITTPTHYSLIYDAPPFIPTSVARWNSPWGVAVTS